MGGNDIMKNEHNESCQTKSQHFCREKSELKNTEIEIYTIGLYSLCVMIRGEKIVEKLGDR